MSKTKGIFLACLVTENRAYSSAAYFGRKRAPYAALQIQQEKSVFILHRKNRDSFASSEHEQGFGSFQLVPRVHGS